jgi:predicted nucleotidyltransferase component of viral defense system
MDEVNFPYPHDADRAIFRDALAHSEATTGFTATLIEKDYYCSLILQYFFDGDTSLVFRGGTCLSKVHTDFYRLSEDLNFIIPVPVDTSRYQRRAKMEPVKRIFNKLSKVVPGIAISEVFKGHNESRQYIGCIEYQSAIIETQESIKLEVGLREPLIKSSVSNEARTIVVNPFSDRSLLPTFSVRAMAVREAYAEKARAAMTRREPAIRDFFDMFHAVHKMGLKLHDREFLDMVRRKLDVPGNDPVDVSKERKRELDRQLDGQLKPVLRPADFVWFNLNEAFEIVCNIAKDLSA